MTKEEVKDIVFAEVAKAQGVEVSQISDNTLDYRGLNVLDRQYLKANIVIKTRASWVCGNFQQMTTGELIQKIVDEQ